ncbi:Septum site-determining protein MinD [Bacillus velezensis]
MPLLGRIPLKQPDWDKDQFAPSVYDRSHPIGEIYMGIAQKVIEKTAE